MAKKEQSKRAMVFKVGRPGVVCRIGTSLETWQKLVGGTVERLPLWRGVALYSNEEGRRSGLPVNRRFDAVGTGGTADFVVYLEKPERPLARPGQPGYYEILGDFFVVRELNGGTVDLTDTDITKLKKLFKEG